MKLTPSSTARRKTFFAFSRSGGQPQMPSPVSRIAPNPSRLTKRSPPNKSVSSSLLVLAAARNLDKSPVKTPAAPAEIAPKNVRRVTSLCIEFPSLLLLNSYFLLLTFLGPLHPRDLIPKTFFVSSELKYTRAIDSQPSPSRRPGEKASPPMRDKRLRRASIEMN